MEEYHLITKGDSSVTYILIHGIGADWRCWQRVVDTIPAGRIFVLNLPGFGGTEPVKNFNQNEFNRFLNKFIHDTAKPESSLYLFGHSLGAILLANCIQDLELTPQLRTRTKLVLFHFPYSTDWLSFGAKNILKAIQGFNLQLLNGVLSQLRDKNKIYIQLYDLYKKLFDPYVKQIEQIYGEYEFLDQFVKMDVKAGQDSVDILNHFSCIESLEKSDLPVVAIWGQKDHTINPKMSSVVITNPRCEVFCEPEFTHGSYIFEPEKCLKLAHIL
jgi:pimeloyl-ACP methyl ester carboxylesterase